MLNWLTTNWFLVAVVLYAVASEIIGMSKLKENSVIQVVLRMLGRICGRV